MSTCDIHYTIDACSPKEAYEKLCTAEHFESGYAPYNGTITTTSIIGEVSHTTYGVNGRVTPASIKKAQKIGDELNDVNKRQCRAIDCGIKEWQVLSFKKQPSTKATMQFQAVYTIMANDEPFIEPTHNNKYFMRKATAPENYKTIAEARKHLNELLTNHVDAFRDAWSIKIVKRMIPVDESASDVAVEYVPTRKVLKSKPKSVPSNSIVMEIHTYVIYGLACC